MFSFSETGNFLTRLRCLIYPLSTTFTESYTEKRENPKRQGYFTSFSRGEKQHPMANHKSAIKKMRKDEVRRVRNKAYKTRTKTAVKKVLEAVEAKNAEAAEKAFHEAVSTLDRIAGKGIIHKNTVARKKSLLAKKVNALKAAAVAK